ncbi:MAG TPA: DUF465 domain-containing protein [Aeromonadales bacterium]|nr:DUF465 domain-containing protein [Aeromonadales bacterium]
MLEKHDLHHEFPEHFDRIHQLKMENHHFLKLFEEYDELVHEINRIEEEIEVTTDEYLEDLKKKRLLLKDKLYAMIIAKD